MGPLTGGVPILEGVGSGLAKNKNEYGIQIEVQNKMYEVQNEYRMCRLQFRGWSPDPIPGLGGSGYGGSNRFELFFSRRPGLTL